MKIQDLSPVAFPMLGKSHAAGMPRAGTEVKTLTPVSISPASYTKFDFLQRLRAATGAEPGVTFLERLAEQYGTIRKELEAGSEADASKETLAMLDEVYDEAAAEAADRLAGAFDAFFNYAPYGFGEDGNRFDRQAFKAHLLAMAQDAKAIAASGSGSVAEMLARKYAPSDRLETAGYRDLDALSGAVRDILRTAPPIDGGDAAEYGAAVADWHKSAQRRLASSGLSDAAMSGAAAALEKQAAARLKAGAYTRAVDDMQAKVEEELRELARLNAQRKWIEELLEQRVKELPPGHPMLQLLLERERQLSDEAMQASARMKEWKEKGKDLVDSPQSVTDTDQYREVMQSYAARMQDVDRSNEA